VPSQFEFVAATSRSGWDESWHAGAVVGLAADGSIALAVGDPGVEVYPRSANKPLQATAMVRAGLTVPDELLALVCASHSGTPEHLAGVERLLAVAGLTAEDLANTPDWPLDAPSMRDAVRSGGEPTALQMNCSGKHAGMLVTCVACEWDHSDRYLQPDHPLQRHIAATIAELTGEAPAHVGVDGCGAPAHVLSLLGLARAYRTIATGGAGLAGDEVRRAMVHHPFMVGGPGRDVTAVMESVPGLMAKDGAEGVYAAALPDGRAVAMKVADGGGRARAVVLAAALAALGVDVTGAAGAWHVPVLGHGAPVGVVRPLGALAEALPMVGEV
jgi:L-asparaginase II